MRRFKALAVKCFQEFVSVYITNRQLLPIVSLVQGVLQYPQMAQLWHKRLSFLEECCSNCGEPPTHTKVSDKLVFLLTLFK